MTHFDSIGVVDRFPEVVRMVLRAVELFSGNVSSMKTVKVVRGSSRILTRGRIVIKGPVWNRDRLENTTTSKIVKGEKGARDVVRVKGQRLTRLVE